MKKSIMLVFLVALVMVASPVMAGIYTFSPSPSDLYDLDHSRAYSWGLKWDHKTERVDEVILSFNNIYNWQEEENALFIRMLNYSYPGVQSFRDDATTITDYFDGQGTLVDIYSDPLGGPTGSIDLTYSFRDLGLLDEFTTYASDGIFGLAFDPDCHFYNDGISLTVLTNVPEPATFALFGLGLVGGYARRRFKK